MFHLNLKWCSKLYHFENGNLICEAKKECTLTRFSSSKRRVPYGVKKKKLWGVQTSLRQNCLAALKIKQGRPFRSAKQTLVFYFCAAIFWSSEGVKNFLEPSKIRFKRGFFFTINQLQSIKKHRRSHYVFSFWETCKCAFLKEWF